ncbi:hypothetical protein [Pasteurella multocida]|uniref:hypothetical protein n=1 Tax=Pasteurella multocida TaxID=747 RepID=UPI00292F1DC0|nr:hypothetical protein [Pasteurella multocida]WNY75952.1 hypothetical protein H2513_08720 [Pasteurella multocida]
MNKHIKAGLAWARAVRAEKGEKTIEIGEFELAKLRDDKKRLDFMEDKCIEVIVNAYNFYQCTQDKPTGLIEYPIANTVREAIDNAMAMLSD